MGAQKVCDDNGDDDNHHGEKWMNNPLNYSKVLGWSRKWKIIKYYWPNSRSNHSEYFIIYLKRENIFKMVKYIYLEIINKQIIY